ncbi:MAG: phosphatidate cytidylyltransferase [Gammaproteobacteria bacterium]|nr:phosphatidate cytidylyltransferase [Gammaproteobacteria bacterium]
MLLPRAITAVVLAICFVLAATQVSSFIFAHMMTGTMMLVSWEWSTLAGLRATWQRLFFVGGIFVILVIMYPFLGILAGSEDLINERVVFVLCLGSLFWFLSFFVLLGYPWNLALWNDPIKISLSGFVVIVSAWCGVVQLKYLGDNGEFLLMVVVLVAVADIGAYFFGRSFGEAKLAKELSPNKTWAGVWGGVGSTMAVCFPLIWIFNEAIIKISYLQSVVLFILALIIVFFSIVGDLMESMFKRNQNIKDSGTMLPGHGGILDRVDGLVAAVPIFTLVVLEIF